MPERAVPELETMKMKKRREKMRRKKEGIDDLKWNMIMLLLLEVFVFFLLSSVSPESEIFE